MARSLTTIRGGRRDAAFCLTAVTRNVPEMSCRACGVLTAVRAAASQSYTTAYGSEAHRLARGQVRAPRRAPPCRSERRLADVRSESRTWCRQLPRSRPPSAMERVPARRATAQDLIG